MKPQKKNKTWVNLTPDDVKFIYHAVYQHMDMVRANHGMAWDSSLEKEAARLESLKERLPMDHGTQRARISKDDFWFLAFTLSERTDFVNEGVGLPWCKAPRYDSVKTLSIIDRLRRTVGITHEEMEQGMPE